MATTRTYGEACGIPRALDRVGERWALMVVRELVLGPKRFTDLRTGSPAREPQRARAAPARARGVRRRAAPQAAAARRLAGLRADGVGRRARDRAVGARALGRARPDGAARGGDELRRPHHVAARRCSIPRARRGLHRELRAAVRRAGAPRRRARRPARDRARTGRRPGRDDHRGRPGHAAGRHPPLARPRRGADGRRAGDRGRPRRPSSASSRCSRCPSRPRSPPSGAWSAAAPAARPQRRREREADAGELLGQRPQPAARSSSSSAAALRPTSVGCPRCSPRPSGPA